MKKDDQRRLVQICWEINELIGYPVAQSLAHSVSGRAQYEFETPDQVISHIEDHLLSREDLKGRIKEGWRRDYIGRKLPKGFRGQAGEERVTRILELVEELRPLFGEYKREWEEQKARSQDPKENKPKGTIVGVVPLEELRKRGVNIEPTK